MQANTVFLRFRDEEEAAQVLTSAGITCLLREDGTLDLPCDGDVKGIRFALDRLFGTGTLHHPTGESGVFEGEAIPLTAPLEGYHINLSWDGPVPEELLAYLVHPATPSVRFL